MKLLVIGDACSTHVRKRTSILEGLGASCTFLSHRSNEEDDKEGVIVPKFTKHLPWPLSRYRTLFDIASTFHVIRSSRVDFVMVQFAASRLAWLAMIASRKPLAVVAMGGDVLYEEQADLSAAEAELTCLTFRAADVVFAKSPYLAEKLQEMGVEAQRINVCLWGVDPSNFNQNKVEGKILYKDYSLPESAIFVLSPRILQPLYNIDKIIMAMSVVIKNNDNVHLLVAEYHADEKYKEHLINLIENLNLQKYVHFIGSQSTDDMARLYKQVKISVSIPPSDGMPMTVLEAMACGVPNIVSDLPHYRSLLKNNDNVLYASEGARGLANSILRLLSDDEMFNRLRLNGLKFIREQATLPQEAQKVMNVMLQLLASNPSGRKPICWRGIRLFFATIWPAMTPKKLLKR